MFQINNLSYEDGYNILFAVIASLIFLAVSLTSLAIGIIIEYTYFKKQRIICNDNFIKYKEIIAIVFLVWIMYDKYLIMIEHYHNVNHLSFIFVILFFDVIYIGMNLFIKYVLKFKKLDFTYIALFLLIVYYMFVPFGDVFDFFDIFEGDSLASIRIFNLSFYSYILFKLIKIIYLKRKVLISPHEVE